MLNIFIYNIIESESSDHMNYEGLKIPNHVAIILDGNGRWATARNLSRSEGHRAGFDNLKTLAQYILSKNIKYLSVYAFSTENFKRSKEEVDFLMNLFIKKFTKEFDFCMEKNIKVVFSGREKPLPKKVHKAMIELEEKTKNNTGGVFNVCLNYGGHAEIIDACKKIALDSSLNIEELNEEIFNKYLYNDLPPIDFMIRTSGECRISNFMLWQLSYAEFYFPDTYFPDFDEKEFDKAILAYNKRDRRFGGINYEKKSN